MAHEPRSPGAGAIASPATQGGTGMVQAVAVLAVAAAAVSFVAGVGTYLYIRFTQGRQRPPGDGKHGAGGP